MEFNNIGLAESANRKVALTWYDYFLIFVRTWFGMSNSFNYVTYMGSSYAWCLYPVVRKIYKNNKQMMFDTLLENCDFFNCNQYFGTFIVSLHASMIERNVTSEETHALKLSLMGPLSGIGDSLMAFTIPPILTVLGVNLAADGLIAGPIVTFFGLFIIKLVVSYIITYAGFRIGTNFVDVLTKKMKTITMAGMIVGVITIVGISIQFIHLNLNITWTQIIDGQYKDGTIMIFFDKIAPALLPVIALYVYYSLIKKAHWSVMKLIYFSFVIAFIGGTIGFLA